MDSNEYRLKERQVSVLNDISSCVDDLRSDLNNNSEVNCKKMRTSLSEITDSVDALTSQVSLLNKTMCGIINLLPSK